ncbi:hypothetical protein L1987_65165 [Smallanthus sonchifolius]|uniref:Uncharacterized protein n=1 Tax=Smallanthus sonchifolius TaxID=185202 RepID=A0ACB9BTW8_9ASTR|nr:hypothetical protein L1987_65165 [Smallanthus sonchifolius]
MLKYGISMLQKELHGYHILLVPLQMISPKEKFNLFCLPNHRDFYMFQQASSSSMTNQACHHHDPAASMLTPGNVNMNMTHSHANNGHLHHGHNVIVNPLTFIGTKPSDYDSSSSSGSFEMED